MEHACAKACSCLLPAMPRENSHFSIYDHWSEIAAAILFYLCHVLGLIVVPHEGINTALFYAANPT